MALRLFCGLVLGALLGSASGVRAGDTLLIAGSDYTMPQFTESWVAAFNARGGVQVVASSLLAEAGVPCSAVLDTVDLFEDPHLRERGFVETLEHEALGPVRVLGAPVRLSASRVDMRAAPLLGAHTAEVLSGELGIESEQLAQWAERGVVGLG